MVNQPVSWCKWVRWEASLCYFSLDVALRSNAMCLSVLIVWKKRKTYIYGPLCWEISHRLTHLILITMRTLRSRSYVTHSKSHDWEWWSQGSSPAWTWEPGPSYQAMLPYWPEKAMAKIPPVAASRWNLSRTWLVELWTIFLAKLLVKTQSRGTDCCGPSLQ